jgi:putative lipoic acid-binding regulatory protein
MEVLSGRPEISYPCAWTYRIVCTDEAAVRALVASFVGTSEHRLTHLGASSGGRYTRLELVMQVRDEAQRNEVYVTLTRATMVQFVL